MTLPTMLGKKSARGSFNLFVGIVSQNVILAIGAIVIGRLLGSAFYGLYTLSLVPATFIGLFSGLGFNSAIIRFAAQHSHRDEQRKLKETIITGVSFSALIGTLLSILCFLLANPIANLFGRPDSNFLIQITSLTIVSDALVVASQSVCVGLERTGVYSSLVVLRATLHTGLQTVLVTQVWPPSSFAALGAVVGYAIASFVTCFVGLAICFFVFLRKTGDNLSELKLSESFSKMFNYGIPLYVSRVVGGFLHQFLNVLMVMFASDTLIGNYRVSLNFTVLISFFVAPIGTVLFPTFSKLEFRDDAETLRKVFRASVKYTALLIVPVTALVIVLSKPLVSTLYGSTYEVAPFFLSLYALFFLYAGLGQYSISNILNGQGETRKSMALGLLNVAVGLPLAIILAPRFQIVGLIVATVISGFPLIVFGYMWVKRLYGASIDWIVIGKIFLFSLLAGLTTFVSVNFFDLPSWVQLFVGATVLSVAFVILTPILGIVNSDDIQNLRTIFSEIGFATAILHIPLKIMSKLCRQ